MPQHMPRWEIVVVAAVIAAWVGSWGTPALAMNAFVGVTGQTLSGAPGDDGALQAGVPFPRPERFTPRGDGTVKDNLTNLIWLADADCVGFVTSRDALMVANALASGLCGLTDRSVAGDWRLPNVKELHSLIDFRFVKPALSNAAGTGPCTATDCAFSGVQSDPYWSSTTYATYAGSAGSESIAWGVDLYDGATMPLGKGGAGHVWPVRGGVD